MGQDLPTPGDATPGPFIAALAEQLADRLRSVLDQAKPAAKWLTIQDASKYCGLSSDSIRRLIDAGDLRAYRPVGGRVLVDRAELDEFIIGTAGCRPRRGRGIRSTSRSETRRKRWTRSAGCLASSRPMDSQEDTRTLDTTR